MRMKIAMFKQTAATVGLMSLLWFLYTLTIPGPSQAAIFFDTDFETCATGTGNDFPCEDWNDFGQESVGFLRATTTKTFSGSKSVQLTFNNINGSAQQPSIYRSLTTKQSHIFARVASFQATGFQYGSNGITKRFRFRDDVGYPIFWISIYYGSYALSLEGPFDTGSSTFYSSGIAPTANGWDQIEVEILLNTPGQSNGLARVWINGALRIELLNRAWIGSTPNSIGPTGLPNPSTYLIRTSQIFLQSGVGDLYYDRFAVGDTRIGPMQPKSTSSDSTPPASPKDFQAR